MFSSGLCVLFSVGLPHKNYTAIMCSHSILCYCFYDRCVVLHFALASCSAIIKIYLSHSDSFTSSPASIDGDLYVCNGWQFSITCSHNNTAVGVTRWTFSDLDSCVSISIDHFTSIETKLVVLLCSIISVDNRRKH